MQSHLRLVKLVQEKVHSGVTPSSSSPTVAAAASSPSSSPSTATKRLSNASKFIGLIEFVEATSTDVTEKTDDSSNPISSLLAFLETLEFEFMVRSCWRSEKKKKEEEREEKM